MSENRHYYTDPLAAAWMAKHFGMRFPIMTDCKKQGRDYKLSGLYQHSHRKDQAIPARYYLHPDSLYLLNPQAGDFVSGFVTDCKGTQEIPGLISMSASAVSPIPITKVIYVESEEYRRYSGGKIIQRNGIPFMWPESEAA